MIKWLQKFKLKNTKNVNSKHIHSKHISKLKTPGFCLEIRVDEKGLIYYPAMTNPYLELDPQGYAQVCETMGYIALMEMREKNRILH